MVESILEIIFEILEKLVLKLNLLKDVVQESEFYHVFKPYLENAFEQPLITAILMVAIIGIPYGLYRIRKVSAQREQKLDEMMEEMEEEELEETEDYEEERPLFPASPAGSDEGDLDQAILEELEGEEEDAENIEHYAMGLGQEKAVESEEPDFSEFDAALRDEEELSEPASQGMEEDAAAFLSEVSEDQEEEGDLDETLKELLGEEYDLDKEHSTASDFDEMEEDDLQDKAILDLQAEMEETINQLSSQLSKDDSSYPRPAREELSTEESASVEETNSDVEEILQGATPDENEEDSFQQLTDLEHVEEKDISETSLEPVITNSEEGVEDTEPDLATLSAMEPWEETEPEIIPEPTGMEPLEEAESVETPPSPAVPTRDLEAPSPPPAKRWAGGKGDLLISRLETFQHHLERRFQSMEPGVIPEESREAPRSADIDPSHYRSVLSTYKRKKPPMKDKDYLDLLESFIFMAGQKKGK